MGTFLQAAVISASTQSPSYFHNEDLRSERDISAWSMDRRETALPILVGSSFSNQGPLWKLWWRKRSHLSKLMPLRPGPLQDTMPHQLSQCPVQCLAFAISTGPAPSLGLHGRKLRIKGHTAHCYPSCHCVKTGRREREISPKIPGGKDSPSAQQGAPYTYQ